MEAKKAKSFSEKAKSYGSSYLNLLNQENAKLDTSYANLSINRQIYFQNKLNIGYSQQKLENEGKLTNAGFSEFTDFVFAQKDLFESVERLNSSKMDAFLNIIDIRSKTTPNFKSITLFD